MAVTRTAKGTASSKTSGTTLALASVSSTLGRLIVVHLAYDDQTLDSVTWGSQVMTLGDPVLGAGVRTRLAWCVADATATRTITATWASALTAKALVVTEYSCSTGGVSLQTVHNGTNSGSGTSASISAIGPIQGGTDSVTVGVVGTEGPSGDTAGTWSEPNTNGQRVGTTGNPANSNVTVSEGYRIAATAGSSPALSKTGMTSRDWGAAIRHFYWGTPPSQSITPDALGPATLADPTVAPGAVAITPAALGGATVPAPVVSVAGGGAATVRSASSAASTASVTSLDCDKPAGVVDGDVLYAIVHLTASSGSIDTPSGWTQIGSTLTAGSSTSSRAALFRRVAASEPSTYTFSVTNAGRISAAIVAVQDADTTTPELDSDGAVDTTSGTSIVAPSIDPASDALLLAFFAGRISTNGTAVTYTPDGAMVEEADVSTAVAATSNSCVSIDSQEGVTAGSTGTRTATSSLALNWIAFTVAVAGGAGGGGAQSIAPAALGTATVPAPTLNLSAAPSVLGGATVQVPTFRMTISPTFLGTATNPAPTVLGAQSAGPLAALGIATVPAPSLRMALSVPTLGGATNPAPSLAQRISVGVLGSAVVSAPVVQPGPTAIATALLGGATLGQPTLASRIGPMAALGGATNPAPSIKLSVAVAALGGAVNPAPSLSTATTVAVQAFGPAAVFEPALIVAGSGIAPARLGGATTPAPTLAAGAVQVTPAALGPATIPAPSIAMRVAVGVLGGAAVPSPSLARSIAPTVLGGATVGAPTVAAGLVTIAVGTLGGASNPNPVLAEVASEGTGPGPTISGGSARPIIGGARRRPRGSGSTARPSISGEAVRPG